MPVKFSAEVERAIAEVCPPRDAFDAADFDPVEYLNSRFPDEASLNALPAFLDETSNRLRQTENELLKSVEAQAANATTADGDLRRARSAVSELYDRVSDIRTKAEKSEETVKDLCQHIRELDIAKSNLTASINTLRSIQLWMLQLQALSTAFDKKRYVQCRDALQEAKKYSAQFESMKELPKVKELNAKQNLLCRQIEFYLRNNVFGEINLATADENTMAEACSIIDLMGPESIKKIRDRFIDKALEPYSMRFRRGSEDAELKKTERRYVWIRANLEPYESIFRNVFPRHWCVPQELCLTFCLRTKQELDYQFHEAGDTVDVVVLNFLLSKTIDVERDLTQAMAWKEDFPGRQDLPVYKYNGIILSAFREHMGLFIEFESTNMDEALRQPMVGEGDNACPGWNGEDDVRVGTSLPIAEDIFVFIKESLKRAVRISQQDVLLDMAKVWRTHLQQFAAQITTVLPNPAVTSLEMRRACIVINTADLCQSTSQDLGEQVCARSEAPPAEVAFDEVVDAFSQLYSKAIQALVKGVDRSLSPLLTEYANGGFMAKREEDGSSQDESKLIRSMSTVLHDLVLNCSALVPATTLRFLLDKVAASVIPKYTNTLYKQRRLSDEAVAAMRVDSAAFEKVFLQLPNYNDPQRFAPNALASYIKLVRKEFDLLNRALKTLQVDARGDTFLDVYYEVTLPEDRSIQSFVRLVELKGLRREEVRPWIARLSKRGVVEATRRDLLREAALGLSTGATSGSGGGGDAAASGSGATGGGGGINFAALFSRDTNQQPGSPLLGGSAGGLGFTLSNLIGASSPSPSTQQQQQQQQSMLPSSGAQQPALGGGAAAAALREEESLGSRFANAARTTAKTISFLDKFKKTETK